MAATDANQAADGRPRAMVVDCTSQLREGLAALKRDVAASIRLCSRDFGVLGRELLGALERRERRERALELARDHERDSRERLAARLVEMQGNLRVLCRVRPLLSHEQAQAGESRHRSVVVASPQEVHVRNGDAVKSFSFLRVFDEGDGQSSVFQEVAPLVRAAVDGHHACVFAYGQTGAGKTYTLQGGANTEQHKQDTEEEGEEDGVYARATRLLFETLAARAELFHFSVSLQMVEVYNEEIYDLLGTTSNTSSSTTTSAGTADVTGSPLQSAPSTPASARSTNPLMSGIHVGATSMFGPPPASAGNSPPIGEIRHGEDGVFLKNVASVRVQRARDVADAITRGAGNRMNAPANSASSSNSLNDRASRSHSVVLVHITRTSKVDGDVSAGRLVLVDLAGSERLAKPSSTDNAVSSSSSSSSSSLSATLALREAQHVNKSLAAVGDVLASVIAREKHVPFRNSKLTHLLQDSLSGGARSHALLLVHVSPARADMSETVNSLKFAARVCRPPQVIAGRHRAMRGELQQQRAEVSRLNQVVSFSLVERTPCGSATDRVVTLDRQISTQAAQLQALQDKLAAEVELRKKCEKRLEEDAAAKKKLLLALASGHRSSTSPPDGRRWSLYARKESTFSTAAPPNGIENVAENILRSRERSSMTDALVPSCPDDALTAKVSGVNSNASLATPMRHGRRHSPAGSERKKRGRSQSPSPARVANANGTRSPAKKATLGSTAVQVRR